jgi:hypothetical protein
MAHVLVPSSRDMQGPTEQSNWVIPGKLLTGAWPGSTDFEDHVQIVSRILRAGALFVVVSFFCSLIIYSP